MIKELIELKKEELKKEEKWEEYRALKKEYNQIVIDRNKLQKIEDEKEALRKLKRYTIIRREVLKRGLCNYYKLENEEIVLENATDKKIEDILKNLNKGKRSRFFEVYKDFKTSTKKGLKEYKHYLVDNDLL